MAKRIISWDLDKSVLTMGKYIDSETKATVLAKFDLAKIFPDFLKFNKVKTYTIVYGVKQILADCGAMEKVADKKAFLAKAKFDLFLKGETSDKKVNATGAAENKKAVNSMKAKAEVVSLEGLMAKKLLDSENFTDKDQAKLNEFISIQAKHLASEAEKKVENDKFEKASKKNKK